jgi:hypothetical protein
MRQLDDWIEAYIEFTDNTESAPIFNKWAAISVISSALQKKVRFNLGRIPIYSNMYIVLVAEPGFARKTQAISWSYKILKDISTIKVTADAITMEAMIIEMEDFKQGVPEDAATVSSCGPHHSITVHSKEFETFLGQKADNARKIVFLTDIFDADDRPFSYKTKNQGANEIRNAFLTLLAAATPDSLASSLPNIAIGGGLTSRVLFIWAKDKHKKIPIPEHSQRTLVLKDLLKDDIINIHRMDGVYRFDEKCKQFWIDWYMAYDDRDPKRICKDPAFNTWYSRKPLHILKTCMCVSAARSPELLFRKKNLEDSIKFIEEVEAKMGNTFSAVGRSEITADVDLILKTIKQHGSITERELMQLVWRDIDSNKFKNVMETALGGGFVVRTYDMNSPSKKVTYNWNG